MNGRAKLNYVVDILLFIAMLVLFVTGVVLWGWKKPVGPNVPVGPRPVAQVNGAADLSVKHLDEASKTSITEAPKAESTAKPKTDGNGKLDRAAQPQILWGLFQGQTFWGMTKNGGWKSIHCYVSIFLLLPLFLLHCILHLKWIVQVTGTFFKRSDTQPTETPKKQ